MPLRADCGVVRLRCVRGGGGERKANRKNRAEGATEFSGNTRTLGMRLQSSARVESASPLEFEVFIEALRSRIVTLITAQ